MGITKTDFMRGMQCPKMLWLSKYKPEAFDSAAMNETVLRSGNEVGDLAMGLFGDYREVPFGDLGEMIRIISEKLEDEDMTAMDLAAAFLKDAMGEELPDIPTENYFEENYDLFLTF